MQTYLMKKTKNNCFMIFYCLDNSVQSGEFYPLRILSSLETFIQCRKFYSAQLVWRLLSRANTCLQYGEFYIVWRLLSSMETFIIVRLSPHFLKGEVDLTKNLKKGGMEKLLTGREDSAGKRGYCQSGYFFQLGCSKCNYYNLIISQSKCSYFP